MKKTILFIVLGLLFCCFSFSQLTVVKNSGGPSAVKIGNKNSELNKGSSLLREWIILNDMKCPLQLNNDVGINTIYVSGASGFRFGPTGSMVPSEPITAYEVHHILYNVFGEHSISLSQVDISDFNEPIKMVEGNSWYASDNQIVEYYLCVSYVSTVRTKVGSIWRYNPLDIKQELNNIQIAYEEGFKPSTETKEK